MPLVAAAVCPHPPVLIPEIAAGAAPELDDLRAACDASVNRLLAARPRFLVLLGSGPTTGEYHYPFRASFAGYGVPVEARFGTGTPGGPPLPLSLAVGVWLLQRSGGATGGAAVYAETVAATATVAECVAMGERFARQPAPVALLVMGDGSATRALNPPGYAHPRVDEFDAAVAKALAEADSRALLALDVALAEELTVAGRAPWQVLAAAARDAGLTGELCYDAAPYGVAYHVAVWT